MQAALDTGLKVRASPTIRPTPSMTATARIPDALRPYSRVYPHDCGTARRVPGDIDIHIGFEAEYYPRYFGRLLEMLEPTEYEYLILGQHFLGNELDSQPNFEETDDPARLRQYTDSVHGGAEYGAFSCFAHPDVMHFVGDETLYRAESRRLCREAKACGVPLEINLLGMGPHCYYPREAFGRKRRRSVMRSSSAGTPPARLDAADRAGSRRRGADCPAGTASAGLPDADPPASRGTYRDITPRYVWTYSAKTDGKNCTDSRKCADTIVLSLTGGRKCAIL